MSEQEDVLNIYKIPLNNKTNANRRKAQSRRANNSLPALNLEKDEKVNTIRRQIQSKKEEISLLKARITTLKFQKARNEKKRLKNEKQTQFFMTIRQRFQQDRLYKKKLKQYKEQELQQLRQQTNQMRQQMVVGREYSKSIMKNKKNQDGKQLRKRREIEEETIKLKKSIDCEENKLKAKKIKQDQLKAEQKIKKFTESRLQFAQQNHTNKVKKTVKERRKADKTLDHLRQEEEKMMEECKQSQVGLISSIMQLQSIKPQKKKKLRETSPSSIHS